MPPPNGARISGEHAASEVYVTQAQFGQFLERFEKFATDVQNSVRSCEQQMMQGTATFREQRKDIDRLDSARTESEKRSDEQSGKIRALEEDKKLKDILAQQALENARPRRTVIENLVSALVIGAVLSTSALIYNSWRDAALDERLREREDAARKNPAATHSHPPAATTPPAASGAP